MIKVKTVHIVAGPTAGGKSAKALAMAEALDGVIVNCDSIQLYDGLPVLTAQPSEEEKAAAPHELYGALHPNDICSAGNWRAIAIPLIADILARGKTPIVVGGTGLYIKALTEGLSPVPDIPPEIRARAMQMQAECDALALHEALENRDPVMAARLDPNNKARLIRAWEVLEATGKSLAEWQETEREGPPPDWSFEIHKIMPEREILRRCCDERFLRMMENGALAETEALAARIESGEVKEGVPLTKALGFKELRACLRGEISKDEAVERALAATRQYAKRQVTWFRNQL